MPDEKEEVVSTRSNRIFAVVVAVTVAATLLAVWMYRDNLLQNGPDCSLLNFYVHGLVNLLMQISLFSIFVCIFFFTVVHIVETRAVYLNIRRVTGNILDEMESVTGQPLDLRRILRSTDAMASLPSMRAQDHDIKARNAALRRRAFRLFGAILGGGLALSALLCGGMYAYARRQKGGGGAVRAGCDYPHMGHILRHNAVLLLFVFVTEMFFLYGVTIHFDSVDDNFVKGEILQKLIDTAADLARRRRPA